MDISLEAQIKRLEEIKEQVGTLTSIDGHVELLSDVFNKLEVIEDLLTVKKPVMIASGAEDVSIGSQYPTSAEITEPLVIYNKFLLVFYNGCDKTIDSVTTFSTNAYVDGAPMSILLVPAKGVTYGAAGAAGALFFDGLTNPYLFTPSSTIMLQFNLNAATEADGIIYWRMYGQ